MQVWMVRHKKTRRWLSKEPHKRFYDKVEPPQTTTKFRDAKVYRHGSPAKGARTRCGGDFEVVCFTLVETVEVADA